MTLKGWLISAAAALALGLAAIPAEAVGPVTADVRVAAEQNTAVEQVHYRYRYYRRHHYYRYYRHRPGFYFYYGPRYYHRHHWRRWHW